MSAPKVLIYDIENMPGLASVWGVGQQYVSISQLQRRVRVCSVAWQFIGDDEVQFAAEWERGGRKRMLKRIHAAMDQADICIGFNSEGFDDKHLRREFVEAGMPPPSPYSSIDLLKAARKAFKFESNKLAFLVEELHVGSKRREDMELWNRLEEGDRAARAEMRLYNMQDVRITADLYQRLKGWISGGPNLSAFSDRPVCPKCGSEGLVRRGFYTSKAGGRFAKFSCKLCGGWSRGTKSEARPTITALGAPPRDPRMRRKAPILRLLHAVSR